MMLKTVKRIVLAVLQFNNNNNNSNNPNPVEAGEIPDDFYTNTNRTLEL